MNKAITKQEVLESLSVQLRREDLKPIERFKLLRVYVELRGWV